MKLELQKKFSRLKCLISKDSHSLREYLVDIFENVDEQSIKGKVVEFDESVISKENYIVRLCDGSLGGKGRGIAFINAMIQNMELDASFKEVDIKIPRTAIIGTEEYDSFIEKNNFDFAFEEDINHEELKKDFLKGSFQK